MANHESGTVVRDTLIMLDWKGGVEFQDPVAEKENGGKAKARLDPRSF